MAKEEHQDRLVRWARSGKVGEPAVQAATVIPLRDGSKGLEVLMLRRNSKIAFGGMWVFPGGRVDPEDIHLEEQEEIDSARRAAIREAREEAGLQLESGSLIPYSHWTPPPITPKRFLTWFFLAAAPDAEITIDGGEIREHAWMKPLEALEQRDAGKIELAPPTWVTLSQLAGHANVGDALAAASAAAPERFETHIAVEDEGPVAMWHGDAGWADHDSTRPGGRHRLIMHGSQWRYERSESGPDLRGGPGTLPG